MDKPDWEIRLENLKNDMGIVMDAVLRSLHQALNEMIDDIIRNMKQNAKEEELCQKIEEETGQREETL